MNTKKADRKLCLTSVLIPAVTIFVAVFTTISGVVHGQEKADVEWPCIQQWVPVVEAAVLWPGVIEETDAEKWKDDPDLSKLARDLGDIDEVTDEIRQTIADYAESISETDREQKLNQLAAGILEVANERRSLFMDGIKRYTRQQIDAATKIEVHLNQLHDLDLKKVAADDPTRKELEETVHWQQRIFDKRERAIQSLCDQPVAVEENLGEVLRETAQHLP